MERNEFLLLLDEALELKPGTVKGSETLDSIEGWNSLAIISVMSLVDERLGVNLDPEDIARCTTIPDLAGLLGDRISVGIRT